MGLEKDINSITIFFRSDPRDEKSLYNFKLKIRSIAQSLEGTVHGTRNRRLIKDVAIKIQNVKKEIRKMCVPYAVCNIYIFLVLSRGRQEDKAKSCCRNRRSQPGPTQSGRVPPGG
mmetsp:Transcript_30336/g.48652  ORF Transcript_30336/g.48652 Transcript_30336/m.48652 type:complete len:116 (+) Transcript_30336:103-450(+)